MKIIPLSDVPAAPVDMDGAAGVIKQLPIGSRDGSPSFSFRVFTLAPGGHTPFHSHEWEHINYAISGEGVIVDPDGSRRPFAAGDFALVPPDETHQYRNASDTDDFVMICAVPAAYE